MLRLFEIPLFLPKGKRIHPSMGSVFHGALMEHLPSELAGALHRESLRPYSQCVFFDRETGPVWRLGTMSDRIAQALLFGLEEGGSIFLRQKGYEVHLGEIRFVQECSFEDLADMAFGAETVPCEAMVSFLAPTSFKREGRYLLFPEVRLILQSLLMRWNAFCPDIRIEDEGLLETLTSHTAMTRYQLQSSVFALERQRITGFQGHVSLRFGGTDAMRRILVLLTMFAPFSGIGIKTALGMGAVQTSFFESGRE